jgi:hypothetical protein
MPLASLQLLAPLEPGARVFGVGLNYLSHLTRLGRPQAPPNTIAYIKPESAIVDPGGEIAYPPVTTQLDFEIELVAVVARSLGKAKHASSCLLGYTVGNDISARDAGKQLGSLDLFTQKALDRTAPIGPWIATLNACGGPGQPDLAMRLFINGELRQQDRTSHMIFSLDELLDFVDARVALRPGDLLFPARPAVSASRTGASCSPATASKRRSKALAYSSTGLARRGCCHLNAARGGSACPAGWPPDPSNQPRTQTFLEAMMYSHILVPTDGTALSVHTVTKAVEFARTVGARVTFSMPTRTPRPLSPTMPPCSS